MTPRLAGEQGGVVLPMKGRSVRVVEATDPDGDALTVIADAQGVWITCTSADDEVTLGPFTAAALDGMLSLLSGAARCA